MAKITVSITRKDIYSIAEGISVSISQHNGGTPTYEQLWASADESAKLDIYYREAISDLERRLTEWIQQTSSQFSLSQDGSDYTLVLAMSKYWPTNMQGLLTNKIQDYLVHAVTAGWLNDFEGLNIKQDYQAMSSQDLTDIRSIIYLRAFNFGEEQRGDDTAHKEEPASLTPSDRTGDTSKKEEPASLTPSDRAGDIAKKEEPASLTPSDRAGDIAKKEEPASLTPSDRTDDGIEKETRFDLDGTGKRVVDETVKTNYAVLPPVTKPIWQRHRDNDIVVMHEGNDNADNRTDDDTHKKEPTSLTPSDRADDMSKKEEPASLAPSDRGEDSARKDDAAVLDAGERGEDSTRKVEPGALTPSDRAGDTDTKDNADGLTAEQRATDGTAKVEPDALQPSDRTEDTTRKRESDTTAPSDRATDGISKKEPGALRPTDRAADGNKKEGLQALTAGARNRDDVTRDDQRHLDDGARNMDNASVCRHDDWTDWSGTGIAFRDRMPHRHDCEPMEGAGCVQPRKSRRVRFGYGYTPNVLRHGKD